VTPRELAGHINRAKAVYVWVEFGIVPGEDGDEILGDYLRIEKKTAKDIVDMLREEGNAEPIIELKRGGKDVYIGAPVDVEADEGGEGEEEEEEEEGTEAAEAMEEVIDTTGEDVP
jgi:hypothetical protein